MGFLAESAGFDGVLFASAAVGFVVVVLIGFVVVVLSPLVTGFVGVAGLAGVVTGFVVLGVGLAVVEGFVAADVDELAGSASTTGVTLVVGSGSGVFDTFET